MGKRKGTRKSTSAKTEGAAEIDNLETIGHTRHTTPSKPITGNIITRIIRRLY